MLMEHFKPLLRVKIIATAVVMMLVGSVIVADASKTSSTSVTETATADAAAQSTVSQEFETAISIIKKYEGLHRNKGQLIGYGHKVVAGDVYKRNANLTEAQADKLLRDDLSKLCERYRHFGSDSLLLAALAYNCGVGVVSRSTVYKNLSSGNRDIKASYLSHSRYRGKTLAQLQRRRQEEFDLLYKPD